MLGLFARKVGMTQVFDNNGDLVPVTVIRFDPNVIVAHKTVEKDGYKAVVVGLGGDKKKKLVTKPYGGQFPEAIPPKKILCEIRDFEKETAVGDALGVETLEGCRYVDVSGVSKGKGFQGVVRRYGFGGGRHTHGSKFHREPGSTGNSTYPHHTFKNTKLPGRMGRERVTVLSLKVERIDAEKQLLLVRGAVPGINEGLLMVRSAVKR